MSGRLAPPGWDSPSFVEHLINCRELKAAPANCVASILSSVRKFQRRTVKGSNSWHGTTTGVCSIQSIMYGHFVLFDSSCWDACLAKRMSILCPEHTPNDLGHARMLLLSNMFGFSSEHKLIVMRSILNGWVTSTRYHEQILLPCVFGCKMFHPIHGSGYKDCLAHYLRCPLLWKLVRDILQVEIPTSPACKLCLFPRCSPYPIIIAFQLYHFIKMGNRPRVLCMCNLHHVKELRELAFRHGSALRSDMRI